MVRFLPCGDSALTVELGREISPAVNARVTALTRLLHEAALPGVRELVPAYCALTVQYDPAVLSAERLIPLLTELCGRLDGAQAQKGELVELPVWYGGFCGPDLGFVAQHAGMTPEQAVALHSAADYLIYMLGFTPGFPYLGGMDVRIAAPRLSSPRVRIPAGSVGIAGEQTGVYPIASPGGWQIIGRTPLKLFDPGREQPFLLSAGQKVRFVPIDEGEYRRLGGSDETC